MSLNNTNVTAPGVSVAGTDFLAQRPVSTGMQRFLAKKGIYSAEDLNERVRNYAPRLRWRRAR